MAADRLALADWERRAPEYGALREYDDGRPVVAAEYAPVGSYDVEQWERLRDQWLELPPHPNVLDALDAGMGSQVLLRYAAIDWKYSRIRLSASRSARTMVAEWGAQLTSAYAAIREAVSGSELVCFMRPAVWIDLGGAARMGFLPIGLGDAGELAPEVRSGAIDERACVFAIGQAVATLCTELDHDDAARIRRVVERCVSVDPNERFRTLDDLRTAWQYAGGRRAVRAGEPLVTWTLIEEGLGWLALDRTGHAIALFEDALELNPHLDIAGAGLRRALARLNIVSGEIFSARDMRPLAGRKIVPGGRARHVAWEEAEEHGRQLETARDFRAALDLYATVRVDDSCNAFVHTALARCYLALGNGADAVDHAQRALVSAPRHLEAHALRARGYLLANRFEDAAKCAGFWLGVAPDEPSAHYTRGRALFRLGRYHEARDAFDRALAANPTMLEAMLLRREADRAAARVRDAVGTQPAMEIALPAHLARFANAIAAGRVQPVIEELNGPGYAADGPARLVLGRCLVIDERFEDAVVAFDQAAQLATELARDAALAKADALMALGRTTEALAVLDELAAAFPTDLEVVETRVVALRRLGRDSDAEEAERRLVVASGGRSELRVRT